MNEKIVRMNEHGICPDVCAGRGVGGWWGVVGKKEKMRQMQQSAKEEWKEGEVKKVGAAISCC